MHELGPAEGDLRVGDVEPEDGLDVLTLLEPASQLPTEEVGDAGDQDASGNAGLSFGYGYTPRTIVAFATRWTAST